MKILTWNCNGAFRKKFDLISHFEADIMIIQECEDPAQCKDEKYKDWANNCIWTGNNKNKGLGIFAKEGIKLTRLDWNPETFKWFVPCRVNDEFNLLGAWCHGAKSPTFGYIGQLWKYMELHKKKFENVIIAGDFNANVIWDRWDRWWNMSDVIKELKELGVESLYHRFFKEEFGKERTPTLIFRKEKKRPFHIDYIFASNALCKEIKSLSIGEIDDWITNSDHMPVFCEIT